MQVCLVLGLSRSRSMIFKIGCKDTAKLSKQGVVTWREGLLVKQR